MNLFGIPYVKTEQQTCLHEMHLEMTLIFRVGFKTRRPRGYIGQSNFRNKLFKIRFFFRNCVFQHTMDIITNYRRTSLQQLNARTTKHVLKDSKQSTMTTHTFMRAMVRLISSAFPTVTMLDFSIWSINASQSASSVVVLSKSAGAEVSCCV